jgi:hypothetical protein
VKDRFLDFGLRVNRAQAMHTTQIVCAVHLFLPIVSGSRFKVQGSKVQGSGFKGSKFRVQGSAPPPAKKTAGQIEKETNEHRTLNVQHRTSNNVFCLS